MAKSNARVNSVDKTSSTSVSQTVDRELAAKALATRRAGGTPTPAQLAALRRVERAREQEMRWVYYRTIPKAHWREMSGRQWKVINEQAERHGIPFGGTVINLPDVVRALHDFLARNKYKLAAPDTDDPLLCGGTSPALERYRDERAKLARMDRIEREGRLIDREQASTMFGQIASVLRSAGDDLQRQYGQDAYIILDDALDECVKLVDETFGEGQAPSTQPRAKKAKRTKRPRATAKRAKALTK